MFRHESNLPEDSVLRSMFELVYLNMQMINPVPGTPDEVYAGWRESWERRWREDDIRCILNQDGGVLRGFIIYCCDKHSRIISIDELQIHPDFQRNGVTFRRLMSQFLSDIDASNCDTIRTYANKLNPFSPKLALKLGFEVYDETERGWRYRISKTVITEKLKRFSA